MTADYYAICIGQFATYMHNTADNKLMKIASGARDDDYLWTETLMKIFPIICWWCGYASLFC
jgi:alpha-L-arabinofuranosidase